MEQPNLGKKILALRLKKGLTQDELASLCNISLRTIQRIETAAVNPRSYTVKLIFQHLDYDFNSLMMYSEKNDRSTFKISSFLESTKACVLDLFNLKTNTMKKLGILSLPIIALSILLFSGSSINAQDSKQVRASIEKSNEKIIKWFSNRKFDSIGGVYLKNAVSIGANGQETIGRQNIIDNYLIYQKKGFKPVEIVTEKVTVSNNLAVELGYFKVKVEGQEELLKGSYMCQWKLQGKKWFIEQEISNLKY